MENVMVTNSTKNKLTHTLAVGAAAVGVLASVGLTATPARALVSGTLSITGDATVPGPGTNNPLLQSTNVNTVVSGTGQFTGVVLPLMPPLDVQLTGSGIPTNGSSSFTFPAIPNFLTIPIVGAPGPGNVVVDISGGTAYGFNSTFGGGGSTTYTVIGPAIFKEPLGYPDLLGTFNITYTRSQTGANVSQGYTLSLQKTDQPVVKTVPEPSSVLGLGLLSLGAFFRRNKKQDNYKA